MLLLLFKCFHVDRRVEDSSKTTTMSNSEDNDDPQDEHIPPVTLNPNDTAAFCGDRLVLTYTPSKKDPKNAAFKNGFEVAGVRLPNFIPFGSKL